MVKRSESTFGLRFLKLFERGPLPSWAYELDTCLLVAVNDAALAVFGRGRDELLAATVFDLHPSADHPRLREALARPAPARGETWRLRRADGATLEARLCHADLDWAGRRMRLAVAADGEAVAGGYAAHGTTRSRKSAAGRGGE